MAVGSQPSEGNISSALTQLALAWRDLATQSVDQRAYLNKLGSDGLVTAGFSSDDAATVLTLIDYMGTVADIYHGTATQATTFDFEDALTVLWGGS